YFGVPSFEGKRVLVDRIAAYYLADEFKTEWSKLDKSLQAASSQRGMLAHYGLDFEILNHIEREDGSLDIELGSPRLRPSSYNEVFVIQGKTGDKHTLKAEKIREYAVSFSELEKRLKDFTSGMREAQPQVSFSQALLPAGGLLDGLRHLLPNESPS